jgi:glycosyltransferase involved in cell wall biosynthesis
MKISATIICKDESEHIGACIRSLLPVADEVIVLDSGSTDDTVAQAEALGARVFHQAFLGHIDQKNKAASLASHPYILSLDADEELSAELQQAILLAKQQTPVPAYSMNRLNNFCGQWIRHTGWYPDRKVRLWHRDSGSWGGTNPHDKVVLKTDSQTQHLKGDILHYTYQSEAGFDLQSDKFARIAAEAMFKQGKRGSLLPPIWRAIFRFVRDYLLKQGFRDGRAGFIISRGNARYTYLKYALLNQYHANR